MACSRREKLLLVMRLKQLAREKGMRVIEQQKNIPLSVSHGEKFEEGWLWELVTRYRRNIHMREQILCLKSPPGRKQFLFIIRVLEEVS